MNRLAIFSEENPSYPLLITFNVILTTFLCVFSSVSTMIADSSIQGELALSDTQSIWLTTLYLLGVNTTVPTANWFAGRFGFKRMYTYGVVIFSLGSLLAALSLNFATIATARVIEGIGAGFVFPVGLALIVQNLPASFVSLGINLYIAGAFGAGLGAGIPLAGFFTQFYSWRDLFFLIVFLSFFTAISCWLTRAKTFVPDRKSFDFLGFLTFSIFISTILIALTMAPIRATAEGWKEPYILFLFTVGFLSFLSCIYIEMCHPYPLFPLSLFKSPIFVISSIAMFLLGMATFASVSVSIQYMLNGLFYEKFITGKIAAVYGLVIGLVSILTSFLAKIIAIPFLTLTGLGFLIFSYFYNNQLSDLTGPTQVIAILIIRGIGIGLALGPTTQLALKDISPPFKTSAATLLTFFRQVGATYGGTLISIFSIRQAIFHTARFAEQTNRQLPAYKVTFQQLYHQFPDAAKANALILKNLLTQAYIQGLNDAFILFGYVTLCVAILLMVIIGFQLWKKYDHMETSRDP